MNFYAFGIIAFFIIWMGYFSECRFTIRSRVEENSSKTYRRKNIKGFKNRLFYTSVREKCDLNFQYLYIKNKILVCIIFASMLFHICFGWINFLLVLDKIILTVVITVVGIICLATQPKSSYEYYRKIRHRGEIITFYVTVVGELSIISMMALWYLVAWFENT